MASSISKRVQMERDRRTHRNDRHYGQNVDKEPHPVAQKQERERFKIISEEFSPRLAKAEPTEKNGAPLLPPPRPPKDDDGNAHEDRFCTAGPTLEGMGNSTQGANAEEMTFPELVARLEAAMGQATLLLNDRLRSLQQRVVVQGAQLTEPQVLELCEIADGIAGGTYHVAKWSHALQQKGLIQTPQNKPAKPSHCADSEEAFASVRFLLPRLMVCAAEAHKGLVAAEKTYGAKAEKQVRSIGIPIEDLRALAPHLERIIARLGRLVGEVRPGPSMREFVPEYFAPVIGRKLAMHILPFLW